MKFSDKLHVAVQRGRVVLTEGGGIIIPRQADMRTLFPCMQSAAWRTVYRSMLREGYVYRSKSKAFY